MFLKYILLIMLLQLSHFFLPSIPLHPVPPLLPAFCHLSSCPWVVHISSLASPFPTLFLTSPCLFCTYHLCFLFTVPSPLILPLPADDPPCDLHFCDSLPVLVVGLVCVFTLQGQVGPWYSHRRNNIHRAIGMSGVTLFMGG